MASAIAAFGAMGAELGVTDFLCLYAQACLEAGLLGTARQALEESLSMASRNGNACVAAEVHRLMGAVSPAEAATPGAIDAASVHFKRALEVARHQGARAFELRAAISLARLWAHGGQTQRGVDLLAPLWASFNDGLATADLQCAVHSLAAGPVATPAPGTEARVRRACINQARSALKLGPAARGRGYQKNIKLLSRPGVTVCLTSRRHLFRT